MADEGTLGNQSAVPLSISYFHVWGIRQIWGMVGCNPVRKPLQPPSPAADKANSVAWGCEFLISMDFN